MVQKKLIEYGSEFDWESNEEYIAINKRRLDCKKTHYFRSGRDAFNCIAQKYKRDYKTVLMPALCCESMVAPFERNGYEILYYRLNEDISANVEDIFSKLKKDTIFVYLNYFGIQALTDFNLKKIKGISNKIVVIEDRTQDILISRQKTEGVFIPDYTIFSIRKWIAIPDGGILYSHFTNEIFNKEKDLYFSTIRKRALKKKSYYLSSNNKKIKEEYRFELQEANNYLDKDIKTVEMNDDSYELLRKINFNKINNSRMKNVCYLLEHIRNIQGVKSICNSNKQSNLYYPILVKDRDRIQNNLAKKNIYCPVIWPIPKGAKGICEVSEYIANHILALPCDQRYKEEDMDYICNVLKSLMEGR